MADDINRREFLTVAGAAVVVAGAAAVAGEAAAAASTQPAPARFAAPPIPLVRIGYVAIGGQGSGHVENQLKIPGCRITARLTPRVPMPNSPP